MVLTLFDGTELSDLHISTMHEKSCHGVFAFSTENTNQIWPKAKDIRSRKGNGMTWTSFFFYKQIIERGEIELCQVEVLYNTTNSNLNSTFNPTNIFLIYIY